MSDHQIVSIKIRPITHTFPSHQTSIHQPQILLEIIFNENKFA
ncbi:hypothetical protein OAV88_03120 [bacterium]|nr:hypothetical protein [bacterium]